MTPIRYDRLLGDTDALRDHIQNQMGVSRPCQDDLDLSSRHVRRNSVVMFVLSEYPASRSGGIEPCLILNKRSLKVRQAGDLCCPGGGLSWGIDRLLAGVLRLPGSPLKKWGHWPHWAKRGAGCRRALPLLLAAGLREAWEEMRLNPLGVSFLGMLPKQRLAMFERVIFPMMGWASAQHFRPNWEVSRIVPIPLRHLLDPGRYGRYRPTVMPENGDRVRRLRDDDFPCFIHQDEHGSEMLWGATYRITQSFLEGVFDFRPPPMGTLPRVHRHLEPSYLNGSRWAPDAARLNRRGDW